MLEAIELEATRGETTLFRGLGFSLAPGALLRVTGANGSGKTSLLRALCGLLLPAAGEVRWKGQNIRRLREEYWKHLAYVGHANALKDDLTAEENLAVAGALAGAAVPAALALVPLAYLLGTFPSAVMVARSRGVDILTQGSGNPGASNVARLLGTRWGTLVFLLDALKGALPAISGLALDTRLGAYVLVSAAVLGHMFPATRHFRGGKGVATMAGAMLPLHPLTFLALLMVWIAARVITRKASLASLLITTGLPIGVAITGGPAWEIVYVVVLCALVLLRHIDNIKRLLGRRELSATNR